MHNSKLHISSVREMIALGILGVAGNIAVFILPVIVGALVDYVDFSIQQASYIASADMFGLGIGTLVWSQFILTASWRKFAVAAALLLFFGNVFCAVTDTFFAVGVSRFIAGIGAGLMLTIGVSGLANTRNPDRVLGIFGMVVTAVASVIFYCFPFLLVHHGSEGMFFTIASFACLAGVSSFFIPRISSNRDVKAYKDNQAEALASSLSSPLLARIMGVFGVFLVFFCMSLFWVYIERVGVANGFVTDQIATGLGIAQFTGVAGALSAAVIATRLGNRTVPMMFTIGLSLLASVVIPTTSSFAFFLAAASALIFSWSMLYPYVIGVMISLDATARLVTYSLVMMTLSKSLSPVLGASLVTETNLSPAYWMCAVGFVCSAILFMPAIVITDRKLQISLP